ncbi:MAG: hypothetical protein HC817_04910 [Saprospiraceae bacterium]|nr:hypothetical protein [Saprospiraceae bacterium]
MIRWSLFQDFFETETMELAYVQRGAKTADFSIGQFQMKPSFVEKLETVILQDSTLKNWYNYVLINEKTEKECRRVRIRRMQQMAWQLRYAYVYWAVAHRVFKNRPFQTARERVRFFAAAYNYGFWLPEKDIAQWQQKAIFPHGKKYKFEQVAYADLAVEFYEKYAFDFEK